MSETGYESKDAYDEETLREQRDALLDTMKTAATWIERGLSADAAQILRKALAENQGDEHGANTFGDIEPLAEGGKE